MSTDTLGSNDDITTFDPLDAEVGELPEGTDGVTADLQEDFGNFLKEVGISTERTLSDEEPDVLPTEATLAAFHNNELSDPDSEMIAFYISRYRVWNDADRTYIRSSVETEELED